MDSTATAGNGDVRLKRKVRSAETKLFEWRPCSCTIVARDGKLLLQLQTPPRDEDSQEEDDSDSETVIIDLATQLLNVVPKKNKARCDLEYYAPVATMRGDVLKEELMASSAAHCQQWIAQVRRVQQQAHQQRRPSSSTSTRPTPSPVAPLPSPLTSHSELNGSRSTRSSISNGVAAVGSSVQSVSVREPSPLRRQNSRAMSGSELGHPEMASSSSSSHQNPLKHHSSSVSLPSSAVSVALPDSLAAVATAASCRVRERCDNAQANANDSEMECTIDSSSGLPAAAFEPTARSDTPPSLISSISSVSTGVPPTCWKRGSAARASSPYYSSSSSSENEMPHSHRRSRRSRPERRDYGDNENNEHGSDEDHEPIRYRRQNYRRGSEISDNSRIPTTRVPGHNLDASSSTHRSPLHQSPTRTRHSAALYSALPRRSTDSYEGDGESSQAELHILQRVEAALRALELENALAKARERELVQEVQTLRDAARVTAAERKHIEQEYRHARREIDSWRRAAQGAEAAAAQLQEQLGIAREENQLLAGEKLRLKRQNSELLTQVHRLDSLVYGRF